MGTKGSDQTGDPELITCPSPCSGVSLPPQAWSTEEGLPTLSEPSLAPLGLGAPTIAGSRRKVRQGPSLQADLLTEAVPRGGLRGLLPAHHCIVGEGLAPGGLSPPP